MGTTCVGQSDAEKRRSRTIFWSLWYCDQGCVIVYQGFLVDLGLVHLFMLKIESYAQ
jgi:hypothetical protein